MNDAVKPKIDLRELPADWGTLQHRVSEFTKHVGGLCTRREIDIDRLAQRLAMDPTQLLKMINGRLMPTSLVLSGLARELHADVRHLKKLAEEIRLADQPSE
jgi:ribosome-binding protein aMBF1 (putative translation factor)